MLKLREKAHASLQAFRDGRGSPLVRSATLCDSDVSAEEDELTLLGGTTRLVGKGSAPTCPPSPHIIQESPSSHHPVVPFPLGAIDEHMHPTVLDYLRSFGPSRTPQPQQPQQLPQPQPVSLTNRASANSMLFTPPAPPLPDPGAIFDMTTSYPSPAVSVPSAPQTPLKLGLTENALDVPLFPAYFPVFDYGGTTGAGVLCSPIHLDPQMPEEQGVRNSSTPEATMQSSWQDLIAQFDFGLY
jgi:hypothetical protein